jgi:hypothetical protein
MSAAHMAGWQRYVSLVEFTGLTPGNKIDKVAINVFAASGNIRYKVYQDDGTGGGPSTLLAESNSFAATVGTTYNLLNAPATIPPSGNVWVGFEPDNNALDIYYTTTVAGARMAELHTFGTGPNPFVTGASAASTMWAGIEITPTSVIQQNNGKSSAHTTGWFSAVSAVKFTGLTPGNKIDKVALDVFAAAGNLRYKIYQDDGTGGGPSTLLAESNSIAATTGMTFNLLNSPATIPPSGNVWVGFEPDNNAIDLYYSSTTPSARVWDLHTFGPGPNPFVVSSSNQHEFWTGIEISP